MQQAARRVLAEAIGEYILIPRSGRSLVNVLAMGTLQVQGFPLPLQNRVP